VLYGTANPPVGVIVSHFPSRDVVGMHDGPRTGIAIAEQNHTRPWLQGSVEPRQRVRCVRSQFDLDSMLHCFSPRVSRSPTNKLYVMVAGKVSTWGDRGHTGL
jgi:hypothetical protein